MMVPMERVDNGEERRSKWATAQTVVVALLIVGLLMAIFVLQNTDKSEVNFLFWSVDVPLSGALLLAAALGGIITFLVTYARRRAVLKRLSRSRSADRDPDSRPPISES
jgi:uncharacterized integral membrane protein